ncbi:MAG TPA: phosphodiester glycosidase family protein [Caulobacteraceae bacterium]|nr:phosphodiester glycosidase family protein [Caulobacteraceae bacterium]
MAESRRRPALSARRRRLAAWIAGATLFALASAVHAAPCRTQTYEGDRFVVCPYAPRDDRLELGWRGPHGALDSFAGLKDALGPRAASVEFAMNAGMYETDQSPLGLLIVDGRTVRSLNRRSAAGNFYLKPNGVFWVDAAGVPHIDETETFAANPPHARWATQSGPLLVDHGALNPQISANGPSLLIRNGVGVRGGRAFFVISDDAVSFGRFTRFLRDGLGCGDALFLDGSVSSLWAPAMGRQDARAGLGAFVIVLRRR